MEKVKEMKKLSKHQYVYRWLKSGKSLTPRTALAQWNVYRLAVIIQRLKEAGMWIINIGKPGDYAKYISFEKGLIKNLEIDGYYFEIIDAEYIDGYADMKIKLRAISEIIWFDFTVQSNAFRDKKILVEKCISFEKGLIKNLESVKTSRK